MSVSRRQKLRVRSAWACVLLVSGTAVSCAESNPFVIAEFDPQLVRGYESMMLEGEIGLDGDCLVIKVEGAKNTIPIFAEGSAEATESSGRPVLVLNAVPHEMGEIVAFGGSNLRSVDGRDYVSVPRECQLALPFWLVNPPQ